MTNIQLSLEVLNLLQQYNVQDICICPGSRNAPLIENLSIATNFNLHTMHEEREAAFYALQKTKSQKIHTAVLTTSGTAAAELLPAVIEAYYQACPLIVVTADRPKYFRGSASPQSIEQANLFTNYATCWDIDKNSDLTKLNWDKKGPLHINVCFAEPIIDDQPQALKCEKPMAWQNPFSWQDTTVKLNCKQPLFIIGELEEDKTKKKVCELLKSYPSLKIIEPLANLKQTNEIKNKITGPEKFVESLLKEQYFDAVIRIGNIPVASIWRRLDHPFTHIPVYSFTKHDFSGLARASTMHKTLNIQMQPDEPKEEILKRLKLHNESWQELIEKHPLSEAAMIYQLNQLLPMEANLFLGNSLPIRYQQYFANAFSFKQIGANRGANGIDGQVASFLGFAKQSETNLAIIGDQTLMYGESALHFMKQHTAIHLFVINNKGGQIFRQMYSNEHYINAHQKNFMHLAKYHNMNYQKIINFSDFNLSKQSCLYEILPDAKQSQDFWSDYNAANT